MIKRHISLLILGFFSITAARSQSIDTHRLDSLFNALSANNLALGTITIAQDGKVLYQRSVGKDASAATTYRIGSITKVFTATLIYQLIDQKILSVHDTLSEFLPDIVNAGRITIDEMLGHRSGLADFTAASTDFDKWKGDPHSHAELLSFIKNQQPAFEPNAKADYNNSNFLLLGFILEKIYHKTFKDIVTERIIHKLGLKNTYYGDHTWYQRNEATSFKYFNSEWQSQKAVYLDNFGGAGAIISTPVDLCTFIAAIFNGSLISKASLSHMTHMEKDWYGRGMFSFGDSTHTGYGHNGQTEGFAASLQDYADNKLAMAYCTNGEVYPKDFIMDKVFKICFNETTSIPTFKSLTVDKAKLQSYTGGYSDDNDLRITCSLVDTGLVMEVKGQPFVLEAMSDREFRNLPFGFFFEFDDTGRHLVVHDAASSYWLHKMN